jgi:glycosyltransferase involved in cell wall biosynthesis
MELEMPLISVIMPVYNRELLVADAIRSIQSQTLEDWELLILDDASTDHTWNVCREFAEKDKRIRVFKSEKNRGCGPGRNELVRLVRGTYIAIQDSDDVSVPHRLQLEFDFLEANETIGLVSGVGTWIDAEDERVLLQYPSSLFNGKSYPETKSELVRILFDRMEVTVPACMFRRSLVEGISDPFGEYGFVDDWHFVIELAHRTLFWGFPEVLVYMKRGKSHTHLWKDYLQGLKEAKKLKKDLYRRYRNDPDSPINYALYRRSIASLVTTRGRYLGGWKGYFTVLESLFWDPFYSYAHQSLLELSGRAWKKLKRIGSSRISRNGIEIISTK